MTPSVQAPSIPSIPSIQTPEDLAALMGGHPLSAEQWAAVTAPLEPVVVIAGAGSGKTTVMAARVVYLVLTGQVRPEEVLGLTFTTKATAELRGRIRAALERAGALQETEEGEVLEPTVATYNAYAAGLLSDHGLRIGHEPDTRVMAGQGRFPPGVRALRTRGVIAATAASGAMVRIRLNQIADFTPAAAKTAASTMRSVPSTHISRPKSANCPCPAST